MELLTITLAYFLTLLSFTYSQDGKVGVIRLPETQEKNNSSSKSLHTTHINTSISINSSNAKTLKTSMIDEQEMINFNSTTSSTVTFTTTTKPSLISTKSETKNKHLSEVSNKTKSVAYTAVPINVLSGENNDVMNSDQDLKIDLSKREKTNDAKESSKGLVNEDGSNHLNITVDKSVQISDVDFCLDSNSPTVLLDNNMMNIAGNIIFPSTSYLGLLPEPACLVIKLKDVTFLDISSDVVASMEIDLSEQNVNRSMSYSFNTSKPIASHLNRTYILTAVLNIGWCHSKDSDEWIRKGDFLSIQRHPIQLTADQDSYQKDIHVVCYSCERRTFAAVQYGSSKTPPTSERRSTTYMEAKTPVEEIGPVAEMSDEIINLSGEIIFPKPVYELPESSCVIVKLKDVSFHDSSSNVLASNIFMVSGRNVKSIEYSLNSKKPTEENLNRVTVVTAVVNVGWCKSEDRDDWLKEGDYLSVMRHRVTLSNDEDAYKQNINVVCYFCKEKRGLQDVVPTGEPITITMHPSEMVEKMVLPADGVDISEGNSSDASGTDEKRVNISGEVTFANEMGTLPNDSCLLVKIKDVSILDGPSYILTSTMIDLGGRYVNQSIDYSLDSKRPPYEHSDRVYAVSAVLNIGWCRNDSSTEWINKGDMLSVKRHLVQFNQDDDTYVTNIELICYACDDETDIIPDATQTPPLSPPIDVKTDDAIKVEMSNKTFNVSGNIIFPFAIKTLPRHSCLKINLQDVTMLDISSSILASIQIDISEININTSISYTLESMKPIETHLHDGRVYTLHVVVNVGWCQRENSHQWLREGDFLSASRNRILLNAEIDSYDEDVNVTCYSCGTKYAKPTVDPKSNPKVEEDGIVMEDDVDVSQISPTKLGDSKLTIDGEILFSDQVVRLPEESCLIIKLKDVTLADAFSDVLATMSRDLSDREIYKSIEYTFKSRKPAVKYLDRVFALSAVVNVGWCSDGSSHEWIRKGDYLSVSRHTIIFEENRYAYGQNIDLVCYSCVKDEDTSQQRLTTPTTPKKSKTKSSRTGSSRKVPAPYDDMISYKGYKGGEGFKGDLGLLGNTGPPGSRGPPGYQGPDGEFGNLGAPGMKGRRGIRGIDGLSGFRNGPKGIRGERGPPGGYGPQGVRGFKGYKGQIGEHGPPGVTGQMGNHGEGGDHGPPGERGFPGKKGAEGKMGFQGPKGKLGPPGPTGKQGAQGLQGDPGDDGMPGIKGYIGAIGHMGFTGEDGNPGKLGKAGPPGTPGIQGDNGYPGIPGKFGGRGIHGEPGERGEIGSTGRKGDNGFDGGPGEIGKLGDPGLRGMRGLPGELGPQGRRGPKGGKGAKGFIGIIGYKGIPGTAGQHGVPGVPGDKIESGTPGEKGPRGLKGNKGAKGPSGEEGPAGKRGPRGPTGEHGNDGTNGAKGARGDPGDTGPMGEKGNRGAVGQPGGAGIKGRKGGRGIVGTRGDIGAKGEEGYPGHPGEPGERGHYGQQGLKGPTGEDGEVGQTGPQGPSGEVGHAGKSGGPGKQGQRGHPGPPGVEGFEGIKGERGLKGSRGPPGPIGPAGAPGEAGEEGIAGNLGKSGTAGTIGPDGKPGIQGMIGKVGKHGSIGPKGDAGIPGKRGHRGKTGQRGAAGKRGLRGKQGHPGQKGRQGDQGKSGYHGERGAAGRRGADGPIGLIGSPGPKGMKGPIGKKGYPGPAGPRGIPGNEGPPGVEGQNGLPGTPGPYGKAGEPGPPGNPGKPGPTGVVGPNGARGETGLKGSAGPRGKRGKTAIDGISGDMGAPGQQGPIGAQGPEGDEGKPGSDGIPGSRGPPGDRGDKGPAGQRGVRGQSGPPGADGKRGDAGELGKRGKDGKDGVNGKHGKPGPAGKKGPSGSDGEPGEKGEEGRRGITGPPGRIGKDGDIGEVGEPGVQGRPGPKGRMGTRGTKGPSGKPGEQGDMGQSSRKIGNPGPEGPDGPAGPRGETGDSGRKGVVGGVGKEGENGPGGVPGPLGKNGNPGRKGNLGRPGYVGSRGKRGPKGRKGALGPAGYTGDAGFTGDEGYKGPKGQAGDAGPTGLKGPPGAPPIESLIPNARWRDYYTKNPTQFYQAVAGEYLTYITTEVDNIKYPPGTRTNPALNCKEIYDNKKYTKNGLKWIDPTRGCSWDAFEVFCNFTASGESCLLNTTSVNLKILTNDKNGQKLLSKYTKISYGISTPQLNFIRILSNYVWQEITLHCTLPVHHRDDIQLMGWNKKVFNAADKNRVQVISNTCEKASKKHPGKFVLRMYTEMDLSDLPIMDMAIKNENINSVELGTTCFL